MALINPPITGDPQLDSWTLQLARQINKGLLPGIGGTGGGGGTSGEVNTGGNTAVYLYQRTASNTPPATRPGDVSYDFDAEPPVVVNAPTEGWSAELPDDTVGAYLWVTLRYVAGQTGRIEEAASWDTPVLLGVAGEDGDDAVFVRVESFSLGSSTAAGLASAYDAETLDFDTLRSIRSTSGLQFRNDGGNTKVLLATVQVGGVDATDAAHYDFTYAWNKNNQSFTPDESSQTLARRLLVITPDDVADGGEDSFICVVTDN